MKKLFTSLLFFPLIASAQITLEHVHVVPTGRVYIMASDAKLRPLAPAGTNQNWDYSNLAASGKDTSRTGMPFWYKGYTNFPESNYAVISNSDTSSVNYFQLSPSAFYSLGIYSSTDTSLFVYHQKTKLLSFPCTYNDTFSENLIYNGLSLELGFDPDSTGPIPMLDSVRFSFLTNRNASIDGWGTLKTPLGTFNVLRSNTREIRSQEVSVLTGGVWIKAPGAVLATLGILLPSADTGFNVLFMTNSGAYGMPLLSYSHHAKDTSAEMQWLYQTPNKSNLSYFTDANTTIYPNPCSDMVYVTTDLRHVSYSISNMNGQVCLNGILDDSSAIEISSLNPGVYFLRLEGLYGFSSIRKLVVE